LAPLQQDNIAAASKVPKEAIIMLNRAYALLDIKGVDEDARVITGMATTPTADRLQDVVEPRGAQFKLPIPFLWQHDSGQPIGHVTHAKVGKGGIEIVAKIAKGVTAEIDRAWALIKAGLVPGLSIGFKAIEHEYIKETKGIRFIKWDFLELSAVTIPANAECTIATVKSIDTAQRAASGHNAADQTRPAPRDIPQRKSAQEGVKMKTLSEQIAALEAKRQASAAQMEIVMQKTLDEDRTSDAAEQETFDTLATEVEAIDKDLTRLRKLEIAKATTAKAVAKTETAHEGSMARGGITLPYAVPAQKIAPADYVWRSLTCTLKSHFTKQSPYDVLKEEYGNDEPTRAVMNVITKAASVPADTVTSGWASQLVETSITEFFAALMPNSVYPSLAAKGGKFSFGSAGIVSMPTRASTPTIAGSFVAQGAPIPVRQGAFSAITFTPKKMAVISLFTREIAEHSTPAIEGLIRQAIVEDTAVAIDSVLLDATAATTTRPAGLKAGVSATTATAGGGIAAVIGDIRSLTGALITGTNGNMRSPVWIMNPADALAISLLPATAGGGEFPFKSEIAGGTLQGYPIIVSSNVTADTMLLVDAADFVSVTGDVPRFSMSDTATVHQEDTTPLQISTGAQGSGVLATPVRSLWQTDCLGVKMILDLNWGLRRTGVVAWTQTMTWN
jgi:HK97 family phage prohead protease/HK97 family phage major capsid protein